MTLHWFRRDKNETVSNAITVLAIGISQPDRVVLDSVAADESWSAVFTSSIPEALPHLAARTTAVILIDRDRCAPDWRTAIESLAQSSPGSCILLVSRVNDEYLWQEVVQHHGFDVLPRPFHPEQVRQSVNKASLFWKSESASRAPAGRSQSASSDLPS